MKVKKITTGGERVREKLPEEWCLYTDTDSVAGYCGFKTKEYGNKSIEEVFDEVSSISTTKHYNDNGRDFIFPKDLNALYVNSFYDKTAIEGKVDYIERHRVKKKMYRIKTANGKFVDVTEDHSVMVVDKRNRLVEKKPTQLKKGDKVITIK